MDNEAALQESRLSMLRARSHLDAYATSSTPNAAEFERLFKVVKAATEEYARLVKLKFKQKYSTSNMITGATHESRSATE